MLFDHEGLLKIAHVNTILQVYIAPPQPPPPNTIPFLCFKFLFWLAIAWYLSISPLECEHHKCRNSFVHYCTTVAGTLCGPSDLQHLV